MSIGPSTLGNLLVQRLDTALGISQTSAHRTGAHPDALRQSPPISRLIHSDESTSRRSAQDATARTKQGDTSKLRGGADSRLETQLQKYTDNRFSPSAPTTLGKTARTILALLNQYQHQPTTGQRPLLTPAMARAAATTTASLQSNPTTQTNTPPPSSQNLTPTLSASQTASIRQSPLQMVVQNLVQALQQNVQQSGLFYESQLAQLAKGQKPLEQLQQQPQAQAHQRSAVTQTATSHSTPNAPLTESAQLLQQSGIDPSTQQLVRQQLETLANQLFSWRGEAWPGVPMDWEVQPYTEEDGHGQAASPNEQTPWQSRLRLELPTLGPIDALLSVHNKTVRLHVHAPQSAEQLKAQLDPLVQRLEAQGLEIHQLHIVKNTDPLYAEEPSDTANATYGHE